MKIKSLCITIGLLTASYCVLIGDFNLYSLFIALIVASASLFLTRILWGEKMIEGNNIHIMHFFFYILILMKMIIISGIHAGKLILTAETKCSYLEYPTNLEHEYQINLLANSITLTPGTVTIKKLDKKLCVMQLLKQDAEVNIEDIKIIENLIRKISSNRQE